MQLLHAESTEKMPNFEIETDPNDRIVFASSKFLDSEKINTHLKLANNTDRRLIYKVKCTNNDMFCITRPVGAIPPRESCSILVSSQ